MEKLLPKSAKNPQGFTLVELLVAIAILAVISVSGLILFTGAQRNARDGRRRQDIDAISQALETNKQATSANYPAMSGSWFPDGNVPADTTTAKYCVAWNTTAGTPPAQPTGWLDTAACPSTSSTPWASNTTSGEVTDASGAEKPPATAANWTVCALLENGGTPYCKSSAQ